MFEYEASYATKNHIERIFYHSKRSRIIAPTLFCGRNTFIKEVKGKTFWGTTDVHQWLRPSLHGPESLKCSETEFRVSVDLKGGA